MSSENAPTDFNEIGNKSSAAWIWFEAISFTFIWCSVAVFITPKFNFYFLHLLNGSKRQCNIAILFYLADDVKSVAHAKPVDVEISSAEGCAADICETRPCDSTEEGELGSSNSSRLMRQMQIAIHILYLKEFSVFVYRMIVSTRNLGRLRKRTAASVAATAEVHAVQVPDAGLSNDEGV